MFFSWLKRYLPRGLYTRAALILILPVVALQLVVSVVFIQRHFEGVTRQMTRSASREVRMLIEEANADLPAATVLQELHRLARPLEITVTFPDTAQVPQTSGRRWFDLSGVVVLATFKEALPTLRMVALPDDDDVLVFADTPLGVMELRFDRRRVSASNPHQLFVNMVFFGVLMTLIAFFYLRNQLRPITRLARAAEAFGKGRNLPYRPAGALEVRAAGNAFLDMRARIERQIEQRTLLLSGVSHDLRTPLTRLKLGLSLLDNEDSEAMERDVEDMQRMLDEFLSFTRGTGEGEPEQTDPFQLVSQVVADNQRAGVPVTLVQTEGEDLGCVALRPLAIRRALGNLIENAVRYGNKAEISVVLTEKSLRIRVEDDGPGIPPDQRGEATKPFTRLDSARNQNRGTGVGLGLAIATDIARAHGGVLRLGESNTLGGLRADIVIGR
ncbi:ATP-binding protein [Thalassovita taeanensis]|uniref:histidine kinase n=1 Tax=Thalassovita taeanensis TaxID=657014 RepID=A0A1H8ZFT9_9RHOB|nr:ATP-binding protein [Thalassovita taeanensis]SEP63234.1 two-component system, OmpR family, osmolarity sensor histidine kinase EnvZ [Thalassovita taeanensis]